MAARPYWSGQIRISLVSFGVKLYSGTEAPRQLPLFQIDRATHQRIRHRNVTDAGEPVENADIVKGYEYEKGSYLAIEPDEIAKLRLPTRSTLEIVQFVERASLDPAYYEKPYYLVPEDRLQLEAFSTIRDALAETGMVGLGEVALGGREHLVALRAKGRGLVLDSLRYAHEVRAPETFFDDIPEVRPDQEQLSLARELIRRRTAPLDLARFTDDYETALRTLIEAKLKGLPSAPEAPEPKHRAKVINLMDALRRSVAQSAASKPARTTVPKKPPAHARGRRRTGTE